MQVELKLLSRRVGSIELKDHLPDVFKEHYLKDATCQSASIRSGHYLYQYIFGEKYALQYYHIIAHEDDEIVMEVNIPILYMIVPTRNFLQFKSGTPVTIMMHERYFNLFYVPHKVGELVVKKGQSYSGLVVYLSRSYIDQYTPQYPFHASMLEMTGKKEATKLFPVHQRVSSDMLYLIETLLWTNNSRPGIADPLEIKIDQLVSTSLHTADHAPLKRMVHIQEDLIYKVYIVKNFLLQHIHEHVQMSRVAKNFGISTYAMTQGFQEIYGYSPREFLYEERMRKALLLLNDGHLSIAQVAERVGYDNVDSFRVAFKRRYSVYPVEYRQIL